MPDTGEAQEIEQRVEARQAEIVRESKQLAANLKEKQSRRATKTKRQARNSKREGPSKKPALSQLRE
jgi:vacuolar-type H+-ATPase subunit E/Vma4